MDLDDGEVRFKFVTSFMDSIIGKDFMSFMVILSASMADDYNDKLLMLSHVIMDIDQFFEWYDKGDK